MSFWVGLPKNSICSTPPTSKCTSRVWPSALAPDLPYSIFSQSDCRRLGKVVYIVCWFVCMCLIPVGDDEIAAHDLCCRPNNARGVICKQSIRVDHKRAYRWPPAHALYLCASLRGYSLGTAEVWPSWPEHRMQANLRSLYAEEREREEELLLLSPITRGTSRRRPARHPAIIIINSPL
jgi:hypothetical protein